MIQLQYEINTSASFILGPYPINNKLSIKVFYDVGSIDCHYKYPMHQCPLFLNAHMDNKYSGEQWHMPF